MIETDIAYFKYNSTYDFHYENPRLGIKDTTISFVEDTGTIYVMGHQFGGKIEYQGINGVTIDGNTIALDIDYIEDLIPLQNVYTAGDYINISNNKISVKYNDLKDALGISTEGETFTLKPAEANILGGIKIGYEDGIASNTPGRCYRVQLDGNNRAFVNVPWTDTKPTTSDDPVPGATEEYVNEKVSEAELRLQDLIEEAAGNGHDEGWWQEMFERYGNQETPEGFDIDRVNNAIVAWAQTESGKNLIVLAFDAREATWKNFVGQKVEEEFAGSQIKQSVDKISLLVGMFDNNGDPNEGDWADFILGLRKNEDGTVTRFADLIADEINIAGTIITPELIASKINSSNLTVDTLLTATNINITGGSIKIGDHFEVNSEGYGHLDNKFNWNNQGVYIDIPEYRPYGEGNEFSNVDYNSANVVSFGPARSIVISKKDKLNELATTVIDPGYFHLSDNLSSDLTITALKEQAGITITKRDNYLSIKIAPIDAGGNGLPEITDFSKYLPKVQLAEKGELCVGDEINISGLPPVRPIYIRI